MLSDKTSIKKPKPVNNQAKIAGPGAAEEATELVIPKIPVPIEELTIKAVRPTRPIPFFVYFLFHFDYLNFHFQTFFSPKKAETVYPF